MRLYVNNILRSCDWKVYALGLKYNIPFTFLPFFFFFCPPPPLRPTLLLQNEVIGTRGGWGLEGWRFSIRRTLISVSFRSFFFERWYYYYYARPERKTDGRVEKENNNKKNRVKKKKKYYTNYNIVYHVFSRRDQLSSLNRSICAIDPAVERQLNFENVFFFFRTA